MVLYVLLLLLQNNRPIGLVPKASFYKGILLTVRVVLYCFMCFLLVMVVVILLLFYKRIHFPFM